MFSLETPISQLSIIGKRLAKQLKNLNLEKAQDLLFYYPFRYEDFSQISTINKLQPGTIATIKGRIRKFRIYKHFLFGGLIHCKECGYKMSACFTNKHRNGKLKRYYYYRCTCINKKSWQACSTKEVSAERIENYILENLERISLDKNYIET